MKEFRFQEIQYDYEYCGYYTSGFKLENAWFLIIDTRILKQQKLKCKSRDTSVYILIYKRRNNFLTAPPDSLNGPTVVISTSKVITETAVTVIQKSVLQDLKK